MVSFIKCRCSRHPRHSELNAIFKRAFQCLAIPSILDPVGLERNEGKRSDGVTSYPWSRGWDGRVWDTTVVDVLILSVQRDRKCY